MKSRQSEKLWCEIRALGPTVAEIWIYEQIGVDFWTGEGITAKAFVEELSALNVSQIDLHINSPGGNVFDGQAIFNALASHPANVTTYIDALAASIASVIALAGNEVIMAENALFMIHEPSGCACGTASDLRSLADVLDKITGTFTNTYVDHSNLSVDEVTAAIKAETWYTATEALDAGFVDQIGDALQVAANFDLKALGYKHVPEPLIAAAPVAAVDQPADATAIDDPDQQIQPEAGAASVPEGGSPSNKRGEAFVPGLGFVKI